MNAGRVFEKVRKVWRNSQIYRFLLVEDEALVRQGMTALLEDEVGAITEVSDGGTGFKSFTRTKI